ncbi:MULTISPECIES: diadenylate cyclase CdaA [unclassified Neochlamydia]|uniref:diadenylate cyclase CdaA n=1 Tax=unclassified Neochlamydia TaxID=2643326 RepID=UPI00140CD3B2|nr:MULTISPECIES: diadenylate cyclase CdaA [unclassified Neochlamydia]MBS4166808.1 Diadenylate cyclase [Neochlamydia sp. AcF65]MBS4170423.1 Diadenylate cyclase [Neochlamydia sp. AcF95]NGY95364.1 Diadenylate cyclase [Neochlamydia sp. AcF84]
MHILSWFIPAIEIAVIAIVVYYLLSFFWNTRTMDLLFGLLAVACIYALSIWLHLPVIEKLIHYFVSVAVVALLIIFQPELRLALSMLSVKGKKYREVTEFDKFLDSMAQSIYRLSEKRVGALLVLENQDSLDEYANKAVIMNANFSSELLESIFIKTTPLHDGAVIIRGTTILSAATILPLADDSSQLSKSMGTRHRAGLGTSQHTDALIIVISEETGKVAIARDGIMTRGVKIDRFKGIMRSIFTPPKTTIQSSFDAIGRLKTWKR